MRLAPGAPGSVLGANHASAVSADRYCVDRVWEALLGNVAQVPPRNLLAAQALHGARCLAGTEVAAVAEQCADKALAWIVDLRIEPGQRAEQFMKGNPLLRF